MDKRILLAHGLFSSGVVYAIVLYLLGDANGTPQPILLYVISALLISTLVLYTTVFPVWKNKVLEEKSGIRHSSLFVLGTACIESSIVYILVCSLLIITGGGVELTTVYPVLFCGILGIYGKSGQLSKTLQEATLEEIFPSDNDQPSTSTKIKYMILNMIPYEILSIGGCIGTIILLYN